MAIDHSAALRHGSQQTNRYGWEDAKTFFDACVHEWKAAQDVHVEIRFALDRTSNLILEFLEVVRVAQKVVRQTAELSRGGFTAGDTLRISASISLNHKPYSHKQRSVHDHLIVRNLVLLFSLLQNIPDEVAVIGLGIHPSKRLLSRVPQVLVSTLADDGRDTPQEKALAQ